MLPLNKKVKILDLIRKEKKFHAEITKIHGKNKSFICEIVKKKNKFVLVLLFAPQTEKLWPWCMISV